MRALADDVHAGVRPARHPRQQRRRGPLRRHPRLDARGLGVGHRREPVGRRLRVPLLRAEDGRRAAPGGTSSTSRRASASSRRPASRPTARRSSPSSASPSRCGPSSRPTASACRPSAPASSTRTSSPAAASPTRRCARRAAKTFAKRGHPPELVGRSILRAIRRNDAVVPVGAEAWASWIGKRFAPSVMSRVASEVERRMRNGG